VQRRASSYSERIWHSGLVFPQIAHRPPQEASTMPRRRRTVQAVEARRPEGVVTRSAARSGPQVGPGHSTKRRGNGRQDGGGLLKEAACALGRRRRTSMDASPLITFKRPPRRESRARRGPAGRSASPSPLSQKSR
jgi:hypothetical protein